MKVSSLKIISFTSLVRNDLFCSLVMTLCLLSVINFKSVMFCEIFWSKFVGVCGCNKENRQFCIRISLEPSAILNRSQGAKLFSVKCHMVKAFWHGFLHHRKFHILPLYVFCLFFWKFSGMEVGRFVPRSRILGITFWCEGWYLNQRIPTIFLN